MTHYSFADSDDNLSSMEKLRKSNEERKKQLKERKKTCKNAQNKLKKLRNLGKCGWVDEETGKAYNHITDKERAKLDRKYSRQKSKLCR